MVQMELKDVKAMSQSLTLHKLKARLPHSVTPLIRRLSIWVLIGQGVLIVSGGIVRLTGSGLGCPTWPKCTAESLTNTKEMGIHGVIEFANRTLTFVLAALALALLIALWNLRKERKDLFWLTFSLLASIPAQAVIGGITVLSGLNPYVVSLHFLVSAALVVFSMLLVNRAYDRTGQTSPATAPEASSTLRIVSIVAAVATYLAVALGTLVTGAGPHSGDSSAPRIELDGYLVTRLHATPVYVLVAAALFLVILTWKMKGNPLRNGSQLLLLCVIYQGIVGYWQYFTGIPAVLVVFHMLGSSLLLATGTNVVDLALRRGRKSQASVAPARN